MRGPRECSDALALTIERVRHSTARIEAPGQLGQADVAQPRDEQRFRLAQHILQRLVYHLLYRAIGARMFIADREQTRAAHGAMNIEQRHIFQVRGEGPAATMALY